MTIGMYVYDLHAYREIHVWNITIMKTVSQSIIQIKDRFCCPA